MSRKVSSYDEDPRGRQWYGVVMLILEILRDIINKK